MRETMILSKTHTNKDDLTALLEGIGQEFKFRIEKENLYNLDDFLRFNSRGFSATVQTF